jgi:antirestriction protein
MSYYIDTRDLVEKLEDEDLPAEERAEIETLIDEIGPEAHHGELLIPVDDFTNYARELADDLGLLPDGGRWPSYCIDWERAARELAQDYSLVTFQGTDYYVRN